VALLLQLLFNGVVVGAVYGLLAVGFGLIFTTTRIFHFAHGAVYTLAGYIVYSLTTTLGWPLAAGIALAMGICGVVSGAIEVAIYRPLRARGASPLVVLIASLSILMLAQNLLAIFYGNEIRLPDLPAEPYRPAPEDLTVLGDSQLNAGKRALTMLL